MSVAAWASDPFREDPKYALGPSQPEPIEPCPCGSGCEPIHTPWDGMLMGFACTLPPIEETP